MEYNSKLTLNENLDKVYEQGTVSYGTRPSEKELKSTEERIKRQKEEEFRTTYPNYCSHPKEAILPSTNSAGVSGKDALIKGYCYYRGPKNTGIFIPQDSKINFWDIPRISNAVDYHIQKNPKLENIRDSLIKNYSELFGETGTVSSFVVGNDNFKTWIKRESNGSPWIFKGYYNEKTNEPYVQPEWVDERSEYQSFVDEWGLAIQITAALATAIAGALTGGAAWVFWAEVALEGTLGLLVGLREVQKGENVAAALSFITGFLPLAKKISAFRGISDDILMSLSKKLLDSGLTSSSSVDDYVKFYNELSESEKLVMSKLLKQDEITKNEVLKAIKSLGDDLPEIIMKNLEQTLKADPSLLKNIKFFDKLWVRELSANSFFMILATIMNVVWGEELNAKDREKLSGVYVKLPTESLKKEFAYNLVANSDKIPQISSQIDEKKIEEHLSKIKVSKERVEEFWNTELKDSFQKAGVTYTELPENKTISVEIMKMSSEDEKKLRDDGWIPETENINPEDVTGYKKINDIYWVKTK